MERTIRITTADRQQQEDLRYWLSQPVQARIAAVEALRRDYAARTGEGADAEQRLQRVCRVTQLKRG